MTILRKQEVVIKNKETEMLPKGFWVNYVASKCRTEFQLFVPLKEMGNAGIAKCIHHPDEDATIFGNSRPSY